METTGKGSGEGGESKGMCAISFIKFRLMCAQCGGRPPIAEVTMLEDIRVVLEWFIKVTDLLDKLLERLKETIKIWKRFCAPDGDLSYFTDLCSKDSYPQADHVKRSLLSIKASFEELEDILTLLQSEKEKCVTYVRIFFSPDIACTHLTSVGIVTSLMHIKRKAKKQHAVLVQYPM